MCGVPVALSITLMDLQTHSDLNYMRVLLILNIVFIAKLISRLAITNNQNNQPTIIANHNSCHHPDFPMSCSLLAPSAKPGISVAKLNILCNVPMPVMESIVPRTTPVTTINKNHHQYSALVARPLKLM